MKPTFSLAEFADPPLDARPVPFWSWNETMDPDEVRRQCRVIRDAGWGGAFLHARSGLRTPYLGEEWFAACEAAIDECRKIGLRVWLYDEEGWPSGVSGCSVPLADEAFRQKVLFARPVDATPPPRSVPLGSPSHGLQLYSWTASLGSWRFNGACYADLLHAGAMECFLEDAYASYHQRFAADYGTTIAAEFLDEPCAVVHVLVPDGALPYTDAMLEAFAHDHGYNPLPLLHLLFQDGPGAERVRIHYTRTASRLFEENFTARLGAWCEARRIALTGHFMEGDLYLQQCKGNAIPQNYRHQGIPGIDHLCMQVSEIVTAKQCHAVVNQCAKPRMLCETYGVAGQNMSFADRWWIGVHLLSLGVTLFNPHLALFTIAGGRKRDFPPNLFFQQPWWPANHAVDEPLTRLGHALSKGRPVAEALVLHPQESAAALFRVRTEWSSPDALNSSDDIATPEAKERIVRLDEDFKAVVGALLGSQRTFDLGDETLLRDMGSVVPAVAGGRPVLRVGAMDYPAIVLPSLIGVAASTFGLLQEFRDQGGPVLLAGDVPTLVEGMPSEELAAFVAGCSRVSVAELPAALASVVPPLVRLEAEVPLDDVFVQIRVLDDGELLVFFVDRRRTGSLRRAVADFAGGFLSAHRLDPFRGIEEPGVSAAELNLELHPGSALLFRVSRAIPVSAPRSRVEQGEVHIVPAADWQVERLDANALVLDEATWREAGFADFTLRPVPLVAIQGRLDTLRYRGPLALRYTFRTTGLRPERKVHLVVEYAERYRITFNGTPVAPSGLPCYLDDFRLIRIDVTGLVQPGENIVELALQTFVFSDPDAPRERQPDRTGTEIEAIYVVGDFHVETRDLADGPQVVSTSFPFGPYNDGGLVPTRVTYVDPAALALTEPAPLRAGDVVAQGLPFYVGRLRLSLDLPALPGFEARVLELDELAAAVAAVEVDGVPAGHLFVEPLRVELPPGAEHVQLILSSTLRNLLGPHHHEAGEPVNCAPWFFLPYCSEGPQRAENVLGWSHGTFSSPNHRASYACVAFGAIGSPRLQSS